MCKRLGHKKLTIVGWSYYPTMMVILSYYDGTMIPLQAICFQVQPKDFLPTGARLFTYRRKGFCL